MKIFSTNEERQPDNEGAEQDLDEASPEDFGSGYLVEPGQHEWVKRRAAGRRLTGRGLVSGPVRDVGSEAMVVDLVPDRFAFPSYDCPPEDNPDDQRDGDNDEEPCRFPGHRRRV